MNFATPSPADFYRVMPELIWCGFGALLMLLQSLTKNRPALTTVAFIGAAAGTATSIFAMRYPGPGFFGLIQQDTFSFFFHLLLGSVAALVILAAEPYLRRERLEGAELPLMKLGLALILIGLGFKVAIAPFQIWTPDVYEGAPTPVSALFAAGPKAAA